MRKKNTKKSQFVSTLFSRADGKVTWFGDVSVNKISLNGSGEKSDFHSTSRELIVFI
jgi:hypothetical protein